MSIDDYRQYQMELQRLNGEYEIPFDEEIKWSDLWSKTKNKPRNNLIIRMSENRLKGYYRKVLETATGKESLRFMFTVTDIVSKTCDCDSKYIYKWHLQDAFQRVQMDMGAGGFATFVMDELNEGTIKQIKATCHGFTVHGDFVTYTNLYQGVLTENSLYSPGIQLADYAAGVMNGYLRGTIITPGKYQFATDLYNDYINPFLRRGPLGEAVGYGVVNVPKGPSFRKKLNEIFDQ